MKRVMLLLAVAAVFMSVVVPVSSVFAQEDAAPVADGSIVSTEGDAAAPAGGGGSTFVRIVFKSGPLSFILWLAIFVAAGGAVYFAVDCAITVRPVQIMPEALTNAVTDAMSEGDVLKALEACENEPGPMANVLMAGFSHVEEGFDVIEDSIATAADLETENLMQKITWLSVVGNLSPMLGLLGTVQGMIAAFSNLAGGAPDVGLLATNISQALFTTAGGLTIAVPCVAFYYIFRNSANKIVLRMEAMTMELIKDLRNVEVVEE